MQAGAGANGLPTAPATIARSSEFDAHAMTEAAETQADAAPIAAGDAATREGSARQQVGPEEPLPAIVTPLDREAIVAKLDEASRRGNLPGFKPGDPEGLCSVAAFGYPFDRKLVVIADAEDNGRTRLRWRLRLGRRMPTILVVTLIVTVWPGEPLLDSLLKTYFGFYNAWTNPETGGWLRTWMWYLPIAIPSVPLTWRWAMRKTRASTHQSARETIKKIAGLLGADIAGPGAPS